ncbi:MAG: hypothetical protein Q2484_01920, partial [Candidatus Sedimenticola sp. (ex Thyasira tokunagai)]
LRDNIASSLPLRSQFPLTGRRVRMPTLLPLWRAARTTGKQCGLTATGDYQPSLRSPWLAAYAPTPMKCDLSTTTATGSTSPPMREHTF